MPIPSATVLLEVWERVIAEPLAVKAFALLAVMHPEAPLETLGAWSVGQRDRALLLLREGLFGTQLSSVATCPACAGLLELEFSTREIMSDAHPIPASFEVKACGHRALVRVPSVRDLAQLATERQPSLLERCLLEVKLSARAKKKAALQFGQVLPEELVNAIAAAMSDTDPQAMVELALECPTCAHRWLAVFDIATYLWRELDAWARRTLQDVHRLASAYGWHEADVLALSPTRRRAYLELVNT